MRKTICSEAKLRANSRYAKVNCMTFSIQLNKNTDADLINKLTSVDNRQGYIKELIRRDLNE